VIKPVKDRRVRTPRVKIMPTQEKARPVAITRADLALQVAPAKLRVMVVGPVRAITAEIPAATALVAVTKVVVKTMVATPVVVPPLKLLPV
jgi:hypothetical protein